MVDATRLIAMAQRLIAANGRTVTFIQHDSTPGDVTKPWQGPASPSNTPDAELEVSAVFVDPAGAQRLGLAAAGDDLLKRAVQVALVSPGAGEDVTKYHELLDGVTRWKLTGVQVMKPGDSVLLAVAGLRR